ncbi:MAG: aspartate kinase [Candidatus Diapherotrites archaeon]|nr:aspartate kinase [Candidatus Diapherotrites archaeon]
MLTDVKREGNARAQRCNSSDSSPISKQEHRGCSVVMKFGGSILSKESELRTLADVVKKRAEKEKIVIVASALKGVTDSLINAAGACLESSEKIESNIAAIREKHFEIVAGIKDGKIRENVEKELLKKLTLLERALYGISYLKELSPRSLDLVQTLGERLSVLLLEAYLQDNGIDAVALDDACIVTNSDFGQALPLMQETKEELGKRAGKILQKSIVILPGFFGTDKKGNIVSFGRGGSDFSAAIIAAALEANALELWKDVDGFMSADPKIVNGARLLSNLSYDEAEELGYFGAKIMYPKTVLPLREKGIPIIVKNILAPEKIGTVVSKEKHRHETIIKSIAVKRSIACVTLRSPAFVGQAGVLHKIFSAMANACVNVDLVTTSETGVSFTIDESDLQAAKEAVPSIDLVLEEVNFDKEVAMVGLVGEGLKRTAGVASKVFNCLGKHGINAEMISSGSSEISLSFIIRENELEKTVKVLHDELSGHDLK